MGRKSNAKAERRALRPPPAIAETVARIEARMEEMDAACPGWRWYLDGMLRDIPRDWPEWCLVPMAAPAAVIDQKAIDPRPTMMAEMAALFSWSKGRSIYRFDADLADAVLATPLTDEIPTELFYRLPEWGIYIEAPPNDLWPYDLSGVFVHLEFDAVLETNELRLFGDSSAMAIPLHLSERTIKDMLKAAIEGAATNADAQGLDVANLTGAFSEAALDGMASWLSPIISCIMYLCTEDADVVDVDPVQRRGPATDTPVRARQRDVGFRIGAALRSTRQRSSDEPHEPTGRHVAPHLRRAHWHHYWRGSLKKPDKRELVLKWIPPIPVNLDKGEIMTVVRNVR